MGDIKKIFDNISLETFNKIESALMKKGFCRLRNNEIGYPIKSGSIPVLIYFIRTKQLVVGFNDAQPEFPKGKIVEFYSVLSNFGLRI